VIGHILDFHFSFSFFILGGIIFSFLFFLCIFYRFSRLDDPSLFSLTSFQLIPPDISHLQFAIRIAYLHTLILSHSHSHHPRFPDSRAGARHQHQQAVTNAIPMSVILASAVHLVWRRRLGSLSPASIQYSGLVPYIHRFRLSPFSLFGSTPRIPSSHLLFSFS